VTTLKKIAIGILKGQLPAAAKDDLAKERMKLCTQCEYFTKLSRQCKLCGCFLDMKTKLLDASCPVEKW
jgi:hypothetical protein